MNNILLCGFMGCGKTTVGQLLAEQLDMTYLDLDWEIERAVGQSIPSLFQSHGEDYFRAREHEAILSLGRQKNCVVATGGGAMTFSRNREAIARADVCLLLDLPFSLCYSRIQNSNRPLVRAHSAAWLDALYQQRMPAYRAAATLTVRADQLPPKVAAEAAQAYLNWKKSQTAFE